MLSGRFWAPGPTFGPRGPNSCCPAGARPSGNPILGCAPQIPVVRQVRVPKWGFPEGRAPEILDVKRGPGNDPGTMPIGSVTSCCARGRGCYVEIVHGDPFEVDFVVFEVIFGPPAFPAALALFFREKGAPRLGSGTRACVIPTQSCVDPTQSCVAFPQCPSLGITQPGCAGGAGGRGTRKV